MALTTFDFAPLYRSTVGFDHLFDMLDASAARPNWPPYDIERNGENHYRISMAVAGFAPNEIELTQNGNTLTATATGGTQPYSYEWFNQQGNSVGAGSSYSYSSLQVYQVMVTDALGCTIEASFNASGDPCSSFNASIYA